MEERCEDAAAAAAVATAATAVATAAPAATAATAATMVAMVAAMVAMVAAARARAEAAEVYLTTGSSTNSLTHMIFFDLDCPRCFLAQLRRSRPYSYGWPRRLLCSDPRSRWLQSHKYRR